jgi:hypothetical protein
VNRTDQRRRFLSACAAAVAGLAGARAQERPVGAARALFAPAEQAVERGLAFLAEAQTRDGPSAGAFGNGPMLGNVAITSLAGLAFISDGHLPGGGKYGPQVERVLRHVLRHAGPDGCLHNPDAAPRGPMYSHGFGTLLLAELHGMVHDRALAADLRARLRRAVELLVKTQNAEGGWRYQPEVATEADLSVTVAQVMALRAAHNADVEVPKSVMDRAAAYIRRCQQWPDGGFAYMPLTGSPTFPMTAAALAGLHCCGAYAGREIDAGREFLQRFRPGRRDAPAINAEYALYGHYYAAHAMRQAGGDAWNAWYAAVRDELCRPEGDARAGDGQLPNRRQRDGSWSDTKYGSHYATALACIILLVPRNCLPIFQR